MRLAVTKDKPQYVIYKTAVNRTIITLLPPKPPCVNLIQYYIRLE